MRDSASTICAIFDRVRRTVVSRVLLTNALGKPTIATLIPAHDP